MVFVSTYSDSAVKSTSATPYGEAWSTRLSAPPVYHAKFAGRRRSSAPTDRRSISSRRRSRRASTPCDRRLSFIGSDLLARRSSTRSSVIPIAERVHQRLSESRRERVRVQGTERIDHLSHLRHVDGAPLAL